MAFAHPFVTKGKVNTPRGVASFAYLRTPSTKFDEAGVFQVDVVLAPDASGMDAFRSALQDYEVQARAELGHHAQGAETHWPVADHKDRDKQLTGQQAIRTKVKAVKFNGDTRRILIVDAATNPIVPTPDVGSGSEIVVACDIAAGVVQGKLYITLQPRVVQVFKMVEFGGEASAESYGLEAGEGYTAPEQGDLPSEAAFGGVTMGGGQVSPLSDTPF